MTFFTFKMTEIDLDSLQNDPFYHETLLKLPFLELEKVIFWQFWQNSRVKRVFFLLFLQKFKGKKGHFEMK